jgi:hypothetical protein
MVANQTNIRPILLRKHVPQLSLIVPFGKRIRRPLDAGTVNLEPRMAYILLGRASVFVITFKSILNAARILLAGEKRLGVEYYEPHNGTTL